MRTSTRFVPSLPVFVLMSLVLLFVALPIAADEPQIDKVVIRPGLDLDAVDELVGVADSAVSEEGTESRYDAGARRDPFSSLLVTTVAPRTCGTGVASLLIDEISLTGVFQSDAGTVVQVFRSDREPAFLLRAGDELCDGRVESISLDAVVFRQDVTDETSPKPWRDVTLRVGR